MRLGIDARLLSKQLTGIGRYTVEISRELAHNGGELFFYMPGPAVVDGWQSPNAHVRASICASRLCSMAWSQTQLPWWATQDRLDLFWGTTHRLPRLLPRRTARVVTIHDLVWLHAGETMRPLSRWMDKHLMPQAIRQADRVIAVSKSTGSAIAAAYPEMSHKIRVVPLGVRPARPVGARSTLHGLGVHDPYVLFVGTLEPRKNLRRLLAAWAGLADDLRSGTKLVLVGGQGWGGVDVHQMVEESGLRADVVIAGYVGDADMATLYGHARFLAMPSLYEGFGLPLLEAMVHGKAVLTSNCSSMPEVAGRAGLLIDPTDVAAITNGLETLISDEKQLASLAEHARATAHQFSWRRAAQLTYSVFEEALTERRARC